MGLTLCVRFGISKRTGLWSSSLHQTSYGDGEAWIMICLSVFLSCQGLLSTVVSEIQHGICGGVKVCICEVNAVSGFVCECHTSGMVMHVCLTVCLCMYMTGVPTDYS